ncbi:PaaI family thioesterase [Alphaproteobacteria bacterium]|nr:PaaI family thioesterase [Alphaproteobacteria bacterium]MDB9869876.1 PaaI family thioesterase [Alphaproteobacteria bacterium]
MSINDIEKSMTRAKSGGTYNFFKTKYIGLNEEAYIFEITFPRECLNPFQTVQGGMIASALDEITSISVNILTKDKMLPSSTDIHVTFHRPAKAGLVKGKAKIIKLGRTVVSVEGKLFSSDNKLVASALHTAILTDTSTII